MAKITAFLTELFSFTLYMTIANFCMLGIFTSVGQSERYGWDDAFFILLGSAVYRIYKDSWEPTRHHS